jgi:hypothetical protein
VADLGVAGGLDLLEATRARLEAALGEDENWRALARTQGAGDDDESADRRARDMRLRLALEENPLYRAWQHVVDAIDAVRQSDTAVAVQVPPAESEVALSEPIAPSEPQLPVAPVAASAEREGVAVPGPEVAIETVEQEVHAPVVAEAEAKPADVAVEPPEPALPGPAPSEPVVHAAVEVPRPIAGEPAAPSEHPEPRLAAAIPELPANADAAHQPALADISELPEEIAALIRRGAEASAAEAAVEQTLAPEPSAAAAEPARAAEAEPAPAGSKAADKLLAIPSVEPVLPAHLDAARRVDRLEAELREMTEQRAAAPDQGEFASEPPPAPEPRTIPIRRRPPPTPPANVRRPQAPPVHDEATVTFVARHTKRPLLASSDLPRTPLFERLQGSRAPDGEQAAEAPADETRFVATGAKPEEAEVTIVTQPRASSDAPPPDKPDPPTAPLRRFLKALSGN